VAIDASKIHGEKNTGYEPPDGRGPFNCGNCKYFLRVDSTCGQSTMRAVSKQPKTADGFVKVDAEGCCEYVERKASAKRAAFQEAQDKRGK
jgi:hypothetical protein